MPQAKAKRIPNKIERVEIVHKLDDVNDPSYIGTYSDSPENEFSIDRAHDGDCPHFWANADVPDDARECDCTSWDVSRNRYFNPGTVEPFDVGASWIPATVDDKRSYWFLAMQNNALQDYSRMTSLDDGQWHYIGIQAVAHISTPDGFGYTEQVVRSGGLWGIESDSDKEYIAEIEQEQLAELRGILAQFGFSKRAIAAAYRRENLPALKVVR
jgi:hypothetical protein